MTTLSRPISRAGRGRRSAKIAAASCLMLLLAACSSTTAGGGGGSSDESVDEVDISDVDESALEETIRRAFLQDVPQEEIDPVVLNALGVASTPLTSEQEEIFETCLQSNSCETGRGSLTIAFPNDNVNPWRNVFRAELTAQAIASPQISEIIYSSASDVAGFLANFRSLVAQQVDIIVINSIFASAIGPVLQQAEDAGITVVEAHTPLPDDVASQVDSQIVPDLCSMFTDAAEQVAASGSSNETYALYTGVAGNSNAATWQPCFEDGMQQAGWSRVVEGFTQWTPQGTAQAANALVASGEDPGAIVYDYTPEDFVQPYIEDGETPPVVVSNVVNQAWLAAVRDAQDAGVELQSLVSNSQVWIGRIAVTAAVMMKAGQDVAQDITSPGPMVPVEDILDFYDPEIPANAPVPSLLTPEQITLALSVS